MPDRVVLHVGLVKAASTKLQRSLFPEHSQIDYLGKPLNEDYYGVITHACWADFDDYDEARLEQFRDQVIRPRIKSSENRLLISFEIMSQMERATRTMVARRMKTLFGECQIIIVLRNQFTWIESYYLWEFGKGSLKMPYADFLFQHWRGPFSDGGLARHLNYASLVQSYADVFGEENIGIFLYEELVEDASAFAHKLCEFMDIDSNQGVAAIGEKREMGRMTQIQKFRVDYNLAPRVALSKFIPTPLNALIQKIGGAPVTAEPNEEWRARITSAYRGSNRIIAKRYGLKLEKYGYPF